MSYIRRGINDNFISYLITKYTPNIRKLNPIIFLADKNSFKKILAKIIDHK